MHLLFVASNWYSWVRNSHSHHLGFQLLWFSRVLAQLAAAFQVQKHEAFSDGSDVQQAGRPLFALSSVL